MKLELIGFKICPFVQRVSLLLQSKNIPHTVTYLNPKEPPDWLASLSPLGKVPLLRVSDDAGDVVAVVFESQVINEFLDESFAPAVMPPTPLERARQRGFVAVADGLFGALWTWMTSKELASVEQARAALCQSLTLLEMALPEQGEFFAADAQHLGVVDCALLPFFMRLALLESAGAEALPCETLPRVDAYRRALLAMPVASASVVPEFAALYLGFVKGQGGLLGEALADKS
ncbi:MAG: glutathione S-transferase family protein [Halothiobacillaceae bacterium]|nr:glutathione S-transferase family protein [Halothiobacillaceae bacterium]